MRTILICRSRPVPYMYLIRLGKYPGFRYFPIFISCPEQPPQDTYMRKLFWKPVYWLNLIFWLPHCVMLRRRYKRILIAAQEMPLPWGVFCHTVSMQLAFIHFRKEPVMLVFGDEFPKDVRALAIWVFMVENRKKT